jgi:hypothetical protein
VIKLALAAATFVVFAFSFGNQSTSVSGSIELEVPEVVTTAKPVPTTVVATTTTVATIVTTTTSTTTTTTVVSSVADISVVSIEAPTITDIEKLICFVGSGWNCGEARAVSWCESWHKPRAVSAPNRNGTIDRGLFQINSVWEPAFPKSWWDDILEPRTNIAMAHHIWKSSGGWSHWTCQP